MSAVSETADKIITAAAELFAERGYASTTTRAIAERAGVNEVTLFRRFENKAGVLAALGERFAEKSAARAMESLPDAEDGRATLLAIARSEIAESVASGGVALRLAFDAASVPEVGALVGEGPAANLRALSEYVASRQAAGEIRRDVPPAVIAEAFSSLTASYVMYRMIMRFIDRPAGDVSDETVEQLFDVFWRGAASREFPATSTSTRKRKGGAQ